MIYLIGGPPRTGKTTLANRIAQERGIPWASTDAIRDVVSPLVDGLVEAGRLGVPPECEAGLLVPSIARFAADMNYLADDYVIEGIGFLPRHVEAITKAARAVFLGFSSVDIGAIDEHAPDSWQARATDEERAMLVPWLLDSSERYRLDAAAHGHPYVDLAAGFAVGQEQALARLFG